MSSTPSNGSDSGGEPGELPPLPSMYHALFGGPPPDVPAGTPAAVDTEETTPRGTPESPFLPSIFTSPVVGTREERQAILQAKAARRKEESNTAAGIARRAAMDNILSQLSAKSISFGDLMDYVFDPEMGQGDIRYRQFFIREGRATQILNWWTSSGNSDKGRDEVSSWAFRYTAKVVKNEAREVTKSQRLQTAGKQVDEKFVMSFSYDRYRQWLESTSAPVMMMLLRAFSVSNREKGKDRDAKANMVITSAALACLGEYSHANNYSKKMLALYLYASGASRQTISIMCTLGYSASWTTTISSYVKRDKLTGEALSTTLGVLNKLSESMRQASRNLAATQLHADIFDNVNIDEPSPEQIIGRHDMQENGTCATIFRLHKAELADMKISNFQDRFLCARKLEITDILHTANEAKQFRENLIFTILRIIVNHGGEQFKKFEKDLNQDQPTTARKIEVHKTHLFPLPAMHIDESSVLGNIKVDAAIVEELAIRVECMGRGRGHVRFKGGDQLSLARLRSIELIRAGHEGDYQGFFWGVWIPGLFHVKIADTTGTFTNHWGQPDTGAQNPGSLWYHNTHLDRLPIVLTSLPPFRVCRDLVFVSLYARVLHCLLRVSGHINLENYAKTATWDSLRADATAIYDTYATASVAAKLREEREQELARQDGESAEGNQEGSNQESKQRLISGDMLFENGVYFLRDALLSREFSDAIKCGDSGRVVLVLKIWALAFRGNGRTKYAYEMLHLIHHLEAVWSPEIRDIVLNNWIINPSGHPNSFVEIDLAQEHLNYLIKASVLYKAHGTAATWEWLKMIAPTVEVLRKLAKQFNDVLGVDQGTKHAPAEISKDIQALMDNLKTNKVYELTKGRVFDGEGHLVTDAVEVGMHALLHGARNPLKDYNESFERLQMRRRTKPVKIPRTGETTDTNSSHSSTTSSPPLVPIKVESENNAESLDKHRGDGATGSPRGSSKESSENGTESELEGEVEFAGNPLYEGDVGEGEAAMPRRTEADVAFDMDVAVDDDGGGAETDSDGEVDEDDEWMTDEEV